MKSRFGIATALVAVVALLLTATASASEPLEDGEYSVTLGEDVVIAFTISDEGTTVEIDTDLLPDGFEVSEDDGSEDTTKITNDIVTVEIRTGDDGKIEVHGLDSETSVTATLPGTEDVVEASLDDGVLQLPDGFEVDIDRGDGSIEIERDDDDSSSDDAESDDSSDDVTDDTALEDSRSDDADSDDDDDSSDDVTESTVEPAADTSVTPPAPAVSDDDDSSTEDDDSDDDSDDEDSGATPSNDDKSDDDDSSD